MLHDLLPSTPRPAERVAIVDTDTRAILDTVLVAGRQNAGLYGTLAMFRGLGHRCHIENLDDALDALPVR